jgi:uncharacterized protein
MMRTRSKALIPTVLLVALLAPALLQAKDIKQRMLERLPSIKQLLDKGVIGETAEGLLAFRGAKEKEDVVGAENADRKLVYEAIAKKQGTTAKLVGQRRGTQIAEKAKAGTWLRNAAGKWKQK